ncbi:hypothetical protein CCS41_06610 [Candidatus Fukatsuia symbiotica]|uniref:HTH-like domain-containing protein n=1 Tax=Candidatus Fukatsuia symbiotica TaxID=1878942 RepID=A0A2U8I521_9GAMM|nr:hypothetical protein CCS41_06610 [Candidatus Fukatsuia symbiotica]
MLGFEGNFLVSSQLYFHGYEHDPYRLQNQASSLITGIEQAVVNMAYDYPAYGQHRVANELNRQGIMISGSGVRSVWLRPYILIINFQRLMIPN